jgi:hypothetical protein
MLSTAIALAQRGMAVFPCWPQTKRPATANGFKDATTERNAIEQWWHREPHYNVAIATGTVSGVFVVDVDGMDAEGELRKLEAEHGTLPATVESITARGRHIFFKCQAERPVRNSTDRFSSGEIHVRGDGGYAVVPPSIHPTGRAYTWSVDCAPSIAAAPDWLLFRIAEPTNGSAKLSAPPAAWRHLTTTSVSEGSRNATCTRLAGHLLRHYIDPLVALALLQSWNSTHCTPPLSDAEVEAIVTSISRLELKRRGHG